VSESDGLVSVIGLTVFEAMTERDRELLVLPGVQMDALTEDPESLPANTNYRKRRWADDSHPASFSDVLSNVNAGAAIHTPGERSKAGGPSYRDTDGQLVRDTCEGLPHWEDGYRGANLRRAHARLRLPAYGIFRAGGTCGAAPSMDARHLWAGCSRRCTPEPRRLEMRCVIANGSLRHRRPAHDRPVEVRTRFEN
jgi:hypothetical protein